MQFSDLSNWTRSTTDGRKYNKTMKLKVGSDRRGNELRRAGSNKPVSQKIRIEGDINTGNYTIFATGTKELGGKANTDIEILAYDASKDKFTVNNQNNGEKYFNALLGPNSGKTSAKKTKFHSDVRVDIFGLAKGNTKTNSEKKYFRDLQKLKGYKSANNIIFTGIPQVPLDAGDQRPISLAAQPTRVDSSGAEFIGPTTRSRQLMFAIEETVQGEYIPPEADPGSRPDVATRETPNTDIDGGGENDSEVGLHIITVGDPSEVEPVQNDPDSTDTSPVRFDYLRYPLDYVPDLGYDYIQITAYKYEPVGLPAMFDDPGRADKKAEARLYKNPLNTIQLPMIGSISETNAVNWTDDQVNEINNIAAGIAYNNIRSVANSDDPTNPFSAVIKSFTDAVGSTQAAIKSPRIRDAIAAYFAGQAAGVPNVLQRAEGRMINNNLELLFNGPSLRSFNFNFKFRPRSPAEADMIRKIIRAFKINSAPVRSADFMFLATPNIFRIQYIYNQDINETETKLSLTKTSREHPYMNRIKPCALVGMNVNYTPEGSYMTYSDGGSMTGYDLSLSFKELEPIYQDDHDKHEMGY